MNGRRYVFNVDKPAGVEAQTFAKESKDLELKAKILQPGQNIECSPSDPNNKNIEDFDRNTKARIEAILNKHLPGHESMISKYRNMEGDDLKAIEKEAQAALKGDPTMEADWENARMRFGTPGLMKFPNAMGYIRMAATYEEAVSMVNALQVKLDAERSEAKKDHDLAERSKENGEKVAASLKEMAMTALGEKHEARFQAKKQEVVRSFVLEKKLTPQKYLKLTAYLNGLLTNVPLSYPSSEWNTTLSNYLNSDPNISGAIKTFLDQDESTNVEEENTIDSAEDNDAKTKVQQIIKQNLQIQYHVDGLLSSAKDAFGSETTDLYNQYRNYVIGMVASLPAGGNYLQFKQLKIQMPVQYAAFAGYEIDQQTYKVSSDKQNKEAVWNSAKDVDEIASETIGDPGSPKAEKFKEMMKDPRVKAFYDNQVAIALIQGGDAEAVRVYTLYLANQIAHLEDPAQITTCVAYNTFRPGIGKVERLPKSSKKLTNYPDYVQHRIAGLERTMKAQHAPAGSVIIVFGEDGKKYYARYNGYNMDVYERPEDSKTEKNEGQEEPKNKEQLRASGKAEISRIINNPSIFSQDFTRLLNKIPPEIREACAGLTVSGYRNYGKERIFVTVAADGRVSWIGRFSTNAELAQWRKQQEEKDQKQEKPKDNKKETQEEPTLSKEELEKARASGTGKILFRQHGTIVAMVNISIDGNISLRWRYSTVAEKGRYNVS